MIRIVAANCGRGKFYDTRPPATIKSPDSSGRPGGVRACRLTREVGHSIRSDRWFSFGEEPIMKFEPSTTKCSDSRHPTFPRQSDSTQVQSFQPRLVKVWNFCSSSIFGTSGGDFSPDAIMRAAVKRAGVSDFDDTDFLEGLNIYLDSLGQSETLHPFGRFYVRQMIIAMLVHRLKLVELLARHPEILNERMVRPIIVLGLPRSGTSLLFNLLAQDPAHRFMANWESFIAQVPPKGHYSFRNDPRRKKSKWVLGLQKYLMPDLDKFHAFIPDGPEECTPILMQGFATQAFAGGFNVPAFSSWLDKADHEPTYRHHKRVLQALQWKYPGERWLLKSPDHIAAIDAILKIHKDACIVHIHRDPVKSVSSWASLNLCYRGVYYRYVDTHELGHQVLNRLANDLDRYMIERESYAAERFLDMQYADLIKDPVKTVRQIYDHFGFQITGEAERRMRAFMSANPRHKHGVHRYEPEDFGLTAKMIRRRFQKYIDSFKVSSTVETQ